MLFVIIVRKMWKNCKKLMYVSGNVGDGSGGGLGLDVGKSDEEDDYLKWMYFIGCGSIWLWSDCRNFLFGELGNVELLFL